jgi:tRNA(Arg) A34 adenosine deaminase TadA
MSNLEKYLNKPVSELVADPAQDIPPENIERHQIYSLLLMAITRWYWNGNKLGRSGVYGLNPSERNGDVGNFLANDYLGHNICALAVDGDGLVMDFEFNHNEIFNSSAEHAEMRLVRRLFSLVQVEDNWRVNSDAIPAKPYGNMLTDVTIYTTLESCSQCSGVMALAMVKEIVYLQRDPGMYFIGNILRRLTACTDLQAPLPISGERIKLPHVTKMIDLYANFVKQQTSQKGPPFFTPTNGHEEYSTSLTSFLCTKVAFDVFKDAECAFDKLTKEQLRFPAFKNRPKNNFRV